MYKESWLQYHCKMPFQKINDREADAPKVWLMKDEPMKF